MIPFLCIIEVFLHSLPSNTIRFPGLLCESFQTDACYPNRFLFYAELQRASGLRVLRRVIERKRSIELSEASASTSSASEEASEVVQRMRKRPPAKLKPLAAVVGEQ